MAHITDIAVILVLVIFVWIKQLSCSALVPSNNSVDFMVIGDWGGLPAFPYRTPIETAVAKQMAKFALLHRVQFVLALGDNFYFDGVKNVEDPRFQETYDKVFSDAALGVDWYLVAGNHDHNGNVSAQIAYSDHEKRWNFPKLYYPLRFAIPSTGAHIDIVMIDTVQLCGNSDSDFVDQQPLGPQDTSSAEDQWQWIEHMLSTSQAHYLLVAGHYPVWSISTHGPTKCLVTRLQPLLHKYRASAYLCGHDHNLQHLTNTAYNQTVEYFVSGAANFLDASRRHAKDVPDGSSRFFWAQFTSLGGYGYVHATKQNATFSFVDASGKTIYEHAIQPRSV